MTSPSRLAARPCPICRKPRGDAHAPFCSTRCKDRDLVRWFSDSYAVPGRPADPEDLDRALDASRD
ncbi:DNA gyrase inhibitor YacG [Altererythrobacter sp. TH136]|uniref:DNA gyrase inhibitor YacG n=1 Tax=Altererythrobacter sp. TH136 TaxID=2067415 RepID=UPI0011645B2B|nr:DNA gyrase inhibitor YacG [Altererythrobacter sp. TH136]QDM40583.1 DNA gyrase inhibitor YacG [Altererythrobacter sp. TH136]